MSIPAVDYDTIHRKHTIAIAMLDQAANQLEQLDHTTLTADQKALVSEALSAVLVAREELEELVP